MSHDIRVTSSDSFALTVRGDVVDGQVVADLRPQAAASAPVAVVATISSTLGTDAATLGRVAFVAPVSGTVLGADLWNSATVTTGNLRVSLQVDGISVFGGTMLLQVGDPTGTIGACTATPPVAVVARTSLVGLQVSGGNTAAGHATVVVYFQPA